MTKVGIIEYDKLAIGKSLMRNNTFLRKWSCPLPSLTNGYCMFYSCDKLESFTSDLPSLTNGSHMFIHCSNLKSFSSDSSGSPMNLSNLTDGSYMFYRTSLPKFKGVLNSLTNADYMFAWCDSLENIGDYPFNTTETGGLYAHSLETADKMFDECPNLKTLHFDINKIKDINNLGLDTCSNLQHVSMSLSSLTTTPTCFYNLQNLETVNFRFRNLTKMALYNGTDIIDSEPVEKFGWFRNSPSLNSVSMYFEAPSDGSTIYIDEIVNGFVDNQNLFNFQIVGEKNVIFKKVAYMFYEDRIPENLKLDMVVWDAQHMFGRASQPWDASTIDKFLSSGLKSDGQGIIELDINYTSSANAHSQAHAHKLAWEAQGFKHVKINYYLNGVKQGSLYNSDFPTKYVMPNTAAVSTTPTAVEN